MKKMILLTAAGLSLVSAACSTSTSNQHAGANHAGMNHNAAAVDHSKMDHSKMDHGTMDHSNMASSPNAASAPYDLQFIDTMVAHHQGAVDMAKAAEGKAVHAELKGLVKSIVADQEREIADMKKWRAEWFAGKPPAVNMDMAGMRDSMKGMDMAKLAAATGNEYDRIFIEQMIPHHEGAVIMAKEALQKSEKPEIKALAAAIIRSQTDEIAKMTEWQNAWSAPKK